MSFFTDFKHDFDVLFHETPKYIHYTQAIVSFAAPFVIEIVGLFDPALSPIVGPIIDRIKTSLATLSVLVGDGSTPITVSAALNALQTNLSDLLDLGDIKNAVLQGRITSTVNIIVGEIEAVQALLAPKS